MNLKRLVLGTAAGALAVTGAHAADLPVAVEPVDYVRICDAYGAGFFYIPGTETCLRVGGRIRADYNIYVDFDDADNIQDNRGFDNVDDQGYRFRARAQIRIDSRTATEFGLLRTYLNLEITRDSRARGGNQEGGTQTNTELVNAFIQFGGLTFGRTTTFFNPGGFGVYTPEQTIDLGDNSGEANLLGYTFAFGNGFSASLALEDATEHSNAIGSLGYTKPIRFRGPPPFTLQGNFGTGEGETRYGGAQIPDIVGNVTLQQGWGAVFVSAAGHYVTAIDDGFVNRRNGGRLDVRNDDEAYGFAVTGGVEVNVPFGTGTTVGVKGGYALGATDYIMDGFNDGSDPVDAVFDRSGDLDLGNSWSVAGGFTTSFTPTINFAAGAGYVDIDNTGSRFDANEINANAYLAYVPVSNFELGVGVEYSHVDKDDDVGDDGDVFTAFFRAQRDF